jgi:membrane protein
LSPDPAATRDNPHPGAAGLRAFASELGALTGQLYNKAAQDNIFFLAGAIAFNIIVAIVPLILATVGIAGLLLQSRFGASASDQIMRFVMQALPPLSESIIITVRDALNGIIEGASGFVGVGALFLIWIATRLVGTLRAALREIFDLQEDRGIILGKLFDMGMVVAAGTLLAINVGGTIIIQFVSRYGRTLLDLDPQRFEGFDGILLSVLALGSIWFMFVLVYRYLPSRRIQWRIAMISATFAAALFEIMKYAFGWYVRNLAVYSSTYGTFATLFIFLLWIYYMSVAFVLGGEVGQVWALRRIRKRQKERLH